MVRILFAVLLALTEGAGSRVVMMEHLSQEVEVDAFGKVKKCCCKAGACEEGADGRAEGKGKSPPVEHAAGDDVNIFEEAACCKKKSSCKSDFGVFHRYSYPAPDSMCEQQKAMAAEPEPAEEEEEEEEEEDAGEKMSGGAPTYEIHDSNVTINVISTPKEDFATTAEVSIAPQGVVETEAQCFERCKKEIMMLAARGMASTSHDAIETRCLKECGLRWVPGTGTYAHHKGH